ncbi:MAG: PH domain-containing protein [Clostridia bacterium]|nr:PH domain-containing protein [Clostridia bacterium]
MQPKYTARKSAIGSLSFWLIVSCILIIPIFIVIFKIIAAKNYIIEFYDDKIITRSGVINKNKKQSIFMGVTATNVEQTLFGRLFNYGNVNVDCVGKWDIDTTNIKNPEALERYLQTKIVKTSTTNQFVHL